MSRRPRLCRNWKENLFWNSKFKPKVWNGWSQRTEMAGHSLQSCKVVPEVTSLFWYFPYFRHNSTEHKGWIVWMDGVINQLLLLRSGPRWHTVHDSFSLDVCGFVSVHQLLENGSCLSPTPQMMLDLQSLASALLETLNDKNVALSHQRKTNKLERDSEIINLGT